MRLSLRQIEVFAAIAQTENVSKAATLLSMSQSAASSALVELERQFDCPLFDRIGKTLRLNSTGHGLIPQARDLLARAADIEGYLAGGTLGPLAVGATLTIGNYLATLVAADYLQQHPNAKLRLHVANTRQIVEQVLAHELDIGLIEGTASDPELIVEPWIDDAMVVFCAPGHPLAAAGSANSQQLADVAWILRESGSGTRALFDQTIGKALPNPSIKLELEHTEAIKRAVESGLGMGCLSRLALRDALRRGSLVEIRTAQFNLNRRFCFVRHRQRQISPAVREFLSLCRSICGSATRTDDLPLARIP